MQQLRLSSGIINILTKFAPVFSQPTFENFLFLSTGAILTQGSRTVTNMLRTLGQRPKHFTTYHNFFKRCECPLLPLSRILCSLIFSLVPGVIELAVDETICRHSGPKVFGGSCHRDPLLSTHKRVQYSFGHKWVVLAVRFHWPWLKRPWALPCLMMLWISEKNCPKYGLKHRTPIELSIIMLNLLHKWFPDRRFIIVGDGGFASLELTKFAAKNPWIQLVSRLRRDAQLFDPAITQPKRGRRRDKGKRLLSPEKLANKKNAPWLKTIVTWYGGESKKVLYMYNQALFYQPGKGTVKIAWVLIRDPKGKLRDEAFYTTDLSMAPEEIIRHFVERWTIEVTFEESKRFLAVESTRNRKKESVLRSFPLLMGLFSLISLWYFKRFKQQPKVTTAQDWYQKNQPTFADAIKTMRKEIWDQNLFSMFTKNHDMQKMPKAFMAFLSDSLAGFA
jgi:DDE superfamily endonuclease